MEHNQRPLSEWASLRKCQPINSNHTRTGGGGWGGSSTAEVAQHVAELLAATTRQSLWCRPIQQLSGQGWEVFLLVMLLYIQINITALLVGLNARTL